MIEKYTDIKKLIVPMINEYIEKVVGPISSFLKLAGLSKKQVTFKTVPFPSVSFTNWMVSFDLVVYEATGGRKELRNAPWYDRRFRSKRRWWNL